MVNSKLAGLALAIAVGFPGWAGADVIHLTNGSALEVTAWRDAGDAIEAALGGGIVRIDKRDIRGIDGAPSSGDLPMHSAPASAASGSPAADRPAAVKAMRGLLQQGQGLFAQTVLTAAEKAEAFRRLGERWRALTVPEALRDVHTRGQQALQIAAEALAAEIQGTLPDVKERLESARAALKDAQDQVGKAAGG
jgi:hypothetical protein